MCVCVCVYIIEHIYLRHMCAFQLNGNMDIDLTIQIQD